MMSFQVDGLTVVLASAVVLVGALLASRKGPDFHPATFREQSHRSKTRNKGESAILRNPITPHGSPLLASFSTKVNTAYDMFWTAVTEHGSRNYMAQRVAGSWVWETFAGVGSRAKNVGAGLIRVTGVAPLAGSGDGVPTSSQMVGIFLPNSPEWIITDHACTAYNLVTVPLYDTFDLASLEHIINQTGMTVIVLSAKHLNKIFDISGKCHALKYVVVVDLQNVPADVQQRADAVKVNVTTLQAVEQSGKANPREPVPPKPADVFTICYTSGTTGLPKGAMITHRNVVAAGAGMCATLPNAYKLNKSDRHLSYLPLSHMFERIVFHTLTHLGCEIGFFSGDITKLFDDIQTFQPTLFPTVPRLLGRLYDKVSGTIEQSGLVKKSVFNLAYGAKRRLLQSGRVTKDSIWDRLVFGKIQARIGGRVRTMLTGAAPISPDVIEFVRIVMGCQVLEGYGQTESTAAGCVTRVGDYQFPFGSHVGVPFPSVEVKLVDVPSMEYYATDKPNPRGEICFRGPLVMKGYFKEPKLTAEAIDSDGWLHTGDVGTILPNGTLKIIDRVKNIFKLSQGEYVAPEKIEQKIKTTYMAQLYVYGDSLQSTLVVIVIPDPEAFLPWAKTQGFDGTLEDACNDERIRKAVLTDITTIGKKSGLHTFEIPKALYLTPEAMTVENSLLTPTFKTKRNVAQKYYASQIEQMYKSLASQKK
ncbi:uncharacterized protein SPPG_07091 [Spizellomyces punctatus DAOM BR117]|uniref:Long-chain-fatty-acid--CoA ligase n=1 Tax=Spizellomyces punctatus (strain DAOM BR117) TaxID=645134 RepID=A0A0L0HAC2_SPIPD|nr:uncharacterized protein SPPG_07091 [Spizellomyces punctatus DAOM BR117]KNC97623.1 hypothetical protein SPPG_07091 [Spizellomyces punctatus DAOM BR117]|eukprot:XP_016605663.1 hypothetical protein SPPG_07091 [Spizellomyces punctatus DAOM BR117]